MNKIERAFRDAYKKRSFLWLMILVPPVLMLSMKIAGYFLETTELLFIAVIVGALFILGRSIIIGSSGFLKNVILKAFYKVEQYDRFASTIDNEMSRADVKAKTISGDRISIWVTATWFVLVTPNGSLICERCDIKKVTSTFREANSKHYLKVILSDKQTFLFPYPELEELLVEWN